MTPPLNDFLQKGIFRPGRKEMAIEVTCLGIKEDEDGHWSWLGDEWCVHRVSVTCSGGSSSVAVGSCRKCLGISLMCPWDKRW